MPLREHTPARRRMRMAELDAQDRDDLRKNQFAYVDREGGEHLPINDESDVRNAIARFNQTDFESKTAKEQARKKILSAAERYGKEIAWKDLVRGYEVQKGEFVVLDPEELEAAKPESSTTIDIGDFVQAEEIDPVYFEKSYFLEPTEVGAKPFSLLKQALEETERVALARVTIRTGGDLPPCGDTGERSARGRW